MNNASMRYNIKLNPCEIEVIANCYQMADVSGRNKEIISLVRRTSVTSNLLVRHSHHLSNK